MGAGVAAGRAGAGWPAGWITGLLAGAEPLDGAGVAALVGLLAGALGAVVDVACAPGVADVRGAGAASVARVG